MPSVHGYCKRWLCKRQLLPSMSGRCPAIQALAAMPRPRSTRANPYIVAYSLHTECTGAGGVRHAAVGRSCQMFVGGSGNSGTIMPNLVATFGLSCALPGPVSRSLKLWFVLRMYGVERLQAYVRHHIALASWFAEQVEASPHLEVMAPQRFGLICFGLAGGDNSVNQRLLDAINDSGACRWCTCGAAP